MGGTRTGDMFSKAAMVSRSLNAVSKLHNSMDLSFDRIMTISCLAILEDDQLSMESKATSRKMALNGEL